MAARTVFVRTDSTTGGNGTTDVGGSTDPNRAYASLSAAEAAEQADLTTGATIGTVTIKCSQGSAGGDDTGGQVTINGWTTNASNIIYIRDNDGDAAARHDGRANDVTGNGNYVLAYSGTGGAIRFLEDYTDVDNIEIVSTNATAQFVLNINVIALTATTNEINLNNLILHQTGAVSTSQLIDLRANNLNCNMTNIIGYGKGRACIGLDVTTTLIFSYCTFFTDAASHGMLNAGETNMTDCVVAGYSTACYNDAAITGSFCAADDTTADNVSATTGEFFNSITPANEFANASVGTSADFTLQAGFTLEDAGVAISGITTDIIDTIRSDPPDIGAFEIISAAGGIEILRRRIEGYV